MSNFDLEIPIEKVQKYLGVKKLNDEFCALFESVKEEVLQVAMPKRMCVVTNVTKVDGFYYLEELDIKLVSKDVNKFFIDCDKIAVIAVTLGAMIDKKISFYQQSDVLRSAVFDACASVLTEAVSQDLKKEIKKNYSDKYLTMSYSVGYGDLSLNMQSEIIEKLQADKLIGIKTNKSNLMVPLKSITAFIGISSVKQVLSDTCMNCSLKGKCEVECNKVEI